MVQASQLEMPAETRPPISLFAFMKLVGVSKTTLHRWIKDGKLKVVNICGRLYIRGQDLAEFDRRAAAGEFAKKSPRKREHDGRYRE